MVIEGIKPYYSDRGFTLYHGNSIELLPKVDEGSVDMVFADPPYNLSNGGKTCQSGTWKSVDKGDWDKSKGVEDDLEFHKKWIGSCRRVLKDEGSLWCSGTYHSIYQCGYAIQLSGMKVLNDVCWFKPNAAPNLSCRYFVASHETLIWALKNPDKKHTFNYAEMKNGGWHEDDLIKREGKQMRSVWGIGKPRPSEKKLGKHPTQKPTRLLERIILSTTNPGDLIVDPFCGSSTTGLMAVGNDRDYVGFDMDEEYLELSVRRYEARQTKTPSWTQVAFNF